MFSWAQGTERPNDKDSETIPGMGTGQKFIASQSQTRQTAGGVAWNRIGEKWSGKVSMD